MRPRRRVGVFSLAALAVLAAVAWLAPAVLVHTSLRDRPLEGAFAGIDGTVTSLAALWANRGADGEVSLREAILAANAGADGPGGIDRIVFDWVS